MILQARDRQIATGVGQAEVAVFEDDSRAMLLLSDLTVDSLIGKISSVSLGEKAHFNKTKAKAMTVTVKAYSRAALASPGVNKTIGPPGS